MHGIGAYRRKLQEQGLINSIDDQIYDSAELPDYARFNELEMLQLIPVIIGELQQRRIDDSEQTVLRTVFGSLWELMVEEADRRQRKRAARSMAVDSGSREDLNEAQPQRHQSTIDPVLKSILRAQRDHELMQEPPYIRHTGLAATAVSGADEHGMAAKLAKLWNEQNGNVEPSQRILKLAAVLIHEQVQRKQSRAQRKASRRQAAAAAATSSEEELLRVRPVRHRRAAAAVVAGAEETDSNEIEGNDEDYSYGDEEQSPAATVDADVLDMFEDDNGQRGYTAESDDLDPALLALRGDDEQLLRQMYGTAAPNDSRYGGSVKELFTLAAEHRLRKQQNRDYLRDSRRDTGSQRGENGRKPRRTSDDGDN